MFEFGGEAGLQSAELGHGEGGDIYWIGSVSVIGLDWIGLVCLRGLVLREVDVILT